MRYRLGLRSLTQCREGPVSISDPASTVVWFGRGPFCIGRGEGTSFVGSTVNMRTIFQCWPHGSVDLQRIAGKSKGNRSLQGDI